MNKILFLSAIIVDITFVFVAARLGRDWLMGIIITNLMLIGVFGVKLVSVLGLVTNVGNAFYACVFLATYFLIERYGRAAGMKTIWFGASFVIIFTVLSQLATRSEGSVLSSEINSTIQTLFSFSPRVFLASILAFVFAQYVNITLYEWVKARTHGKWPWLRGNFANGISQLLDSVLFFTIAFYDLPGLSLVKAILAGWAIKVIVVCIGMPMLSLDQYLQRKK